MNDIYIVIRAKNREKLQTYLAENGIQSLIHYPIAPRNQLAHKEWWDLIFPLTERIQTEVLSRPISPIMVEHEIKKIVSITSNFEKWQIYLPIIK